MSHVDFMEDTTVVMRHKFLKVRNYYELNDMEINEAISAMLISIT